MEAKDDTETMLKRISALEYRVNELERITEGHEPHILRMW